MRPKLISLLVVSAVALVGCSAGEPSVEPTVTVTVTAEDPAAELIEDANYEDPTKTVEYAEDLFVTTAKIRSKSLDVSEPPKDKVISSLHKYCEGGAPINLSASDEYNEVMESMADSAACPRLDEATN